MSDLKATHWQILTFLWKYLRRFTIPLFFLLALQIASTGMFLWQPFFYREAIDSISLTEPGDAQIYLYALRMILIGIGIAFAGFTLTEFSTFILSHIMAIILRRIHGDVFAHVQRLSTKFHNDSFAGGTSRKIGRGVDGMENIMDRYWFNFIPLSVFTIGLMTILFRLDDTIGWIALSSIVVYVIISGSLNAILSYYFSWADEQDTEVTASMVDTMTGNALVKAFATHDREEFRHKGVVHELMYRRVRSWRMATAFGWLQSISMLVIELAIMTYALRLWFNGTFSTGTFVMMAAYIGLMWAFMRQIGNNIRDYLRGIANSEEMVALAHLPIEVGDQKHAIPLAVQDASIEVQSVTFHYDAYHEPLFQDFSLSIKPHERIALVGHSGSGKSTLIKLIMRLYDINNGAILIDGQNIADVTQKSLRSAMSLVPQDPILFHRSISENIAYGKENVSQEDVQKAARHAHAHEFIRELPDGYDTLVGERGVKLSGGERQRVAIARAILADRPILILDEATSSLDSVSENYIQEALEYLLQGRTSIIVAHRLSTVRTCDRIAVMEKGKLLAFGPHEELMKNCSIYREMVELQSEGMLAE